MSTVLLLEPDQLLARTYEKALNYAGYDVIRSIDAQSAIDAADSRRPDLVILELQLTGHNGIEFLYEFRSYAEWQPVPVIIQSLVPPQEFRMNSVLWRELGVVAYLYKPRTSLRRLLTTVHDQLALGV